MRMITLASRRATATAVVVALVAGVVTLGGAIGLGLRWPSGWLGSGPDDTTDFDYSALGRTLGRLRDGYVNEALAGGVAAGGEAAFGSASTRTARRAPVVHSFINDDFEDAYEVRSLPFTARSNTSGATRQSSEPSGCSPVGGTAWYRYTPTSDVALLADTFGTSGATALAVYTGDRLDELSLVGCDLNVVGNAQLGFRPLAGATYWFQLTEPAGGGSTVFELAAVGRTTVETLSWSGGRADIPVAAYGNRADISGDGRWLAFISNARNLTRSPPDCGDAPQCNSLYLRDHVSGTTTLIASAATPANDTNVMFFFPSVSPDGRYVGFSHWDLPGNRGFHGPPDAAQPAINAYLFDRITGSFEIVSRNSAGEVARGEPGRDGGTTGIGLPVATHGAMAPSISIDGRYVTFVSDGANLGGHVEYGKAYNVYRRDRVAGTTRLVSVDSEGRPMRANSFACTGRNMSGDGRYVFFSSTFGTGQDSAEIKHLYLWDAKTGTSQLVTKLPDGVRTQGSYCPSISLDGSRTAFVSRDALVPEDTNGTPDVYAYEVATERLQRVSVTSAGDQTTDANYSSTEGSDVLPRSVSLSADGRFVAFDSSAPDLVPSWVGSTRRAGSGVPGPIQVYVHDVITGSTTLASVSSTGEPLAGNSVVPYLSPDGRAVSFMNSGLWVDRNSVTQLDVMVHELRP